MDLTPYLNENSVLVEGPPLEESPEEVAEKRRLYEESRMAWNAAICDTFPGRFRRIRKTNQAKRNVAKAPVDGIVVTDEEVPYNEEGM